MPRPDQPTITRHVIPHVPTGVLTVHAYADGEVQVRAIADNRMGDRTVIMAYRNAERPWMVGTPNGPLACGDTVGEVEELAHVLRAFVDCLRHHAPPMIAPTDAPHVHAFGAWTFADAMYGTMNHGRPMPTMERTCACGTVEYYRLESFAHGTRIPAGSSVAGRAV